MAGYIVTISIILLIVIAVFSYNYVIEFIEMMYARACLLQTIDQVIKIVRYQQIILSELGIPYKTPICRSNFNKLILSVHRGIIKAYWDLPKRKHNVSESHYVGLEASYTDNINALNLLLADYNIYNVRYSVAKDKCHLLNKMLPEYPFLDQDLQYKLDNGIDGTGAFTR